MTAAAAAAATAATPRDSLALFSTMTRKTNGKKVSLSFVLLCTKQAAVVCHRTMMQWAMPAHEDEMLVHKLVSRPKVQACGLL